MDKVAIGKRVKEIREHLGLRQKELCSAIKECVGDTRGISSGFLSRVESGQYKPSVELLYGLSHVFFINIDWLLTGRGSRKSHELLSEKERHLEELQCKLGDSRGQWVFDNSPFKELVMEKRGEFFLKVLSSLPDNDTKKIIKSLSESQQFYQIIKNNPILESGIGKYLPLDTEDKAKLALFVTNFSSVINYQHDKLRNVLLEDIGELTNIPAIFKILSRKHTEFCKAMK